MEEKLKEERTLKLPHVVWLTLGSLVGAGLVTITGQAAAETGYSVWLAYLIAIILGVVAVIPYFIAAGTAVLDGGMYTTNALFGHPVLGGLTAINSIPVVIGQANVAIGLGIYIKAMFPGVSAFIISVLFVIIFYIFNMLGVDMLTKVQKYMMYILLTGLFIFCVYAFKNFNIEAINFRGEKFFTKGFLGFAIATNMLSFSTQCYYNALSFSKYTINPKKTVLKGMILTVPLLIIVYVGVTLAAAGAISIEAFSGKTLADIAREIMPRTVFMLFTIFGPAMALATTLNGNMSSMSLNLQPAANDGWLPKFLGKKTSKGVPYAAVTLVTILILVPVLFDMSISLITNNVMIFTNVMLLVPFYSIWNIPKKFPELWKKSEAYMNPLKFNIVMGISLVARIILVAFSLVSLSLNNLILNLIAVVVIVLFCIVRYKTGKVSMKPEYSEE